MDNLAQEVANLVYNQKRIPKEVFEQQMSAYATKLLEGIFLGYDCDFAKKNISPQQLTTLRELERNAWIFSGFKASKYINELTQTRKALVRDGQIIPFNEFAKFVRSIDNTYNLHYLNAEYNYAVGASRAVAQWEAFQAEKHILPNLQWDAVLDDRTRDTHRALHGIVKPIDDPFWKIYNIPLDWNCRCDRRQTTADTTGEIPKSVQDIKVHPFFKTNVGETKQLFNDKHPYYKCDKDTAISMSEDKCDSLRKTIKEVADKKLTSHPMYNELFRIKKERLAVLVQNRQQQFDLEHSYGKSGKIYIHKLVDNTKGDYNSILKETKLQAKQGHIMYILPEIEEFEKNLFMDIVFPNRLHKTKQPDCQKNNNYGDLKELYKSNLKSMKKTLGDGASKASEIVCHVSEDKSYKELFRIAKSKMIDHSTLSEIVFVKGKVRFRIDRKKANL